MSELLLLNESVVDQSEIDALGHMNVRNYIYRGYEANRELLRRAGVEGFQSVDLYSRYLVEQYAGATLHTFGGIVESQDGSDVSGYFEVRNPDKDELAATFIIGCAADSVGAIDEQLRIEVPEHGKPRSLSLVRPKPVTLGEVQPHIAEGEEEQGRPRSRLNVVVHPDDCDEEGRLRDEIDLMLMTYDRSQPERKGPVGPSELRDAEGRPYGWAMMEARTFTFSRPGAGDRIVSLGGDIAYTSKVRHTRRWMFNDDSGELVGIHDSISLCIDLEARRSRAIPDEIMTMIERDCLSALA